MTNSTLICDTLYQKDIISIKDLTLQQIQEILTKAEEYKSDKSFKPLLKGKVLASLFFDPSTRTRLSFEAAMQKLGGGIISLTDSKESSLSKGETLYDSIKVISSYCDAIVIRHPSEGSARLAAEASSVPVINGGDGSNEHPTQTLLDLFTISECQGRLEELKIAFVGDLKHGRTVHSLALAAAHYNIRMYFISAESLSLPDQLCHELRIKGVKYSFHKDLSEIIGKLDIIYLTRIQKERFDDLKLYEETKHSCDISLELLKKAKKNLKILHPLPRVNQLPVEIDNSPFAYYFEQAANGLYVREALLSLLLTPSP